MPDRTLRTLLSSGVLIALCAVVAMWMGISLQVPAHADLLALVLGLVISGVAGRLILHRSKEVERAAGAEIFALRSELESVRSRLQDFAQSQGRFVGNIAHEIQTPLATALIETDLLRLASNDPVAVRAHAKSMAHDIGHLSDLVTGFVRLARPFAQEDTSDHIPVFVYDCVVEAVRRSQGMAKAGDVKVVAMLPEPGDGEDAIEVLGDSRLLRTMIENLVRNSVRFSPRGSRVEVQVHVEGESIRLQVRDQGMGIAVEHLESVFDWFFRKPEAALQSSGTGFGLAIARRVAEHHGGKISLRNLPGAGCEFEITLPRWRAENASNSSPSMARSTKPVLAGSA